MSTCPQEETPNYQHVLCLYMPDVYDKDAVIEVGVLQNILVCSNLSFGTGDEGPASPARAESHGREI